MLLECNISHAVVIFESDESAYYTLVAVMFNDEKGYFRMIDFPYPVLLTLSIGFAKSDDEREQELGKVAKSLYDIVTNTLDGEEKPDNVFVMPRDVWGKMPFREIYERVRRVMRNA